MARQRRIAVGLVLGWLASGPLAAQSSSIRLELGAFATATRYDATRLALATDYGAGVRAGWYLSPAFSVEATGARTITRSSASAARVDASELGLSVLATARAPGTNQMLLGVGYSRLWYAGPISFRDHAVHAVLGDRIPLSHMAALRLDGRALYAPNSNAPAAAGGRALNLSLSAGVSVFLAPRPARDADGDLIPDAGDACPDTPSAAYVDAGGCPRDGDNDGRFDGVDRCPDTPPGATVDVAGCQSDADGDGVWNGLDACGDSVAGVEVDSRGCEVLRDADADGVRDRLDRCPGTSAGQRVDDVGCPVLFEDVAGEARPLVLRGVTFELDQAVLTPESHAILDEVAASLVAHQNVHVEIAGHTDDTGSPQHNQTLSLARAEAVRSYLAARGVAADRMIARGYGATLPVAGNDTEEGRALNRRVELQRLVR
jgi:OOP family OmpA-OmpF porin